MHLDPTSLLIFAGALFVAAGSPGPSVAALVARVIASGYRGVLPFLAAMWIGEGIWLTFAVLGLAAIAQTFHLAFVVLKWAGIAYLAYLAWKMWHAPATADNPDVPGHLSPGKMFATGMAVTLGNPKIMVFYMAQLPTIIDLKTITFLGWAELVVAMAVILAVIDLSWALLADRVRIFLRTPRAMRLANRCSAGMMAGAAAAIATRQ